MTKARRAVWLTFGLVAGAQLTVLLTLHYFSLSVGNGGFYPIVLGGDDGKLHYAVAKYMAASGELGSQFDYFPVSLWPTVMAAFMRLTGSDEVLHIKSMIFAASLLNLAAALVVLEALRKSSSASPTGEALCARTKVALLLLVGLFPSTLAYSFGSLYRDSMIYALHLLSVGLLLQAIADRRPSAKILFVLLALPIVYALHEFREYAAYSVVLGALLWGTSRFVSALARAAVPSRKRSVALTWTIMSALVVGAGVALWNTGPVQMLIAFRESYFTMAGSNLRISFLGKGPIESAPLYLYSFLSNVIGPLPWQVRNASSAVSFLIEIPILLFVAIGLWRRRKFLNPKAQFLLAQAFAWFAMISFTNDNIGTAGRLRVVGWQCLFVLFAFLVMRSASARTARLVTPASALSEGLAPQT